MEELDQEILDDFRESSTEILNELTEVVESLEEKHTDFPTDLLQQFSQKIDRIMGAADTLEMMAPDHPGLQRIGQMTRICKKLGYSAAELQQIRFIPLFAGFWAETLEVVEELVENLESVEKSEKIASSFSKHVQGRLEWLGKKINEAGPTEGLPPGAKGSQVDVDAILAEMNK